jgi:predicted transcriptional regulator
LKSKYTSTKTLCPAESNIKLSILEDSFECVAIVFNYLIDKFNQYEKVYVSISTIAKETGYSPRHIIRALKELIKSGFISRNKNGYKESNDYFLNQIFYLPEIRDQLRHLITNFATWGMASLMRASSWFKKNVTLLDCNYNYKNINEQWSALDDIEYLKNHKGELANQEQDVSAPNSEQLCNEITSQQVKKGKINKNQQFRPGQFTPGFNSNYYFHRSDRDFELERAEYYQAIGFIARGDKVGRSIVHDLQSEQVQERQRKQDEARQKSLQDKAYSDEKLAKMKEINENNKNKGGIKGFFANLAF